MNIKNKLSNIWEDIKEIFKNMEKDHVSESSAQCAYYVMLSFVPFVILILTLIQYTSIEAEQLFNIISGIMPSSMNDFVLGIVKELYSKSIGTISVSLIFTLFAAAKGLYALIKGLHLIYNYSDNKKRSSIYLRFTSLTKTIVFIVVIILGLVILVFGRSIIDTLQEHFGMLLNYTFLYEVLTQLVFVVIWFVLFLLVYKFIPGHKITFKSQIIGSLFASIALNIVSIISSKYVNIFNYSVAYGSLTTLMSIMIWIYFVFYIIFLGAEINKFCNLKAKKKS